MEHQGILGRVPEITMIMQDSLDSSCALAFLPQSIFRTMEESLWQNMVPTRGEIDHRHIPTLRLEGVGNQESYHVDG